jgi:uncharacterized alkaline shock family protein YloU
MKVLDKLISIIFSIAMLSLAVVVILLLLNMAELSTVVDIIQQYVLNEEYYYIVLGITIVVALAALKTTIFLSDFKAKDRSPIVVQTENGVVEIERDTIETIVKTVAKSFPEVRDVQAKMYKKDKGIKNNVSITVIQDSNIKSVTEEIQNKVKETVFASTGLTVVNTNIKVKNIYESKVKKNSDHEVKAEKSTDNNKVEQIEKTQNSQDVQG